MILVQRSDRPASLEQLAAKINRYGLYTILLANGAQGSQYVPNHAELFPVKEPQAQAEIDQQLLLAEQCESVIEKNPIFNFVHLYCNTLGQEAVVADPGGLCHE